MLVNILSRDQIEVFELDDSGTFEKLYRILEEKHGYGILRGSTQNYLEFDIVAESDLACGDEIVYESVNFQNFRELDLTLVLSWKGSEYSVGNTFGVSFNSILHSFMFGDEKYFSDKSFDRKIYPFPDHFLPVLKNESDLPTYRFDRRKVLGTVSILKHKFSFKFFDKEIEKSEKFYHDTTKRYELCLKNKITEFISSRLKSSKSVISGSFILYDLKLICRFDDIDVFSESLDLLVDLMNFGGALEPMNPCFKSSFLSYKLLFKIDDKDFIVNYIHVNCDESLTNDIESSSQERVLKFICQRFDISCCITAFDGDTLHYHSSLYSKVFDVCGKTTDTHVANRILKYIDRGFAIDDIKHTETCQRLYSDKPMKAPKTQKHEGYVIFHMVKFGNVRLLKEIIKHVDVNKFPRSVIDEFVYYIYNFEIRCIIFKVIGHRLNKDDWYSVICGDLPEKYRVKKLFSFMSDEMKGDVILKAIRCRNCRFLLTIFNNFDFQIPKRRFNHHYCSRNFKCRIYEKLVLGDRSAKATDCGFHDNPVR